MALENRTFLGVVLTLLLSVASMLGRDAPPVPSSDEAVLSTEEAALDALLALEDGQTLTLRVREVRLNATLMIAASHVVIRGAPAMTRVHCPLGRSAFHVSGSNVTLSGLEIIHCRNASAVRIGRQRFTLNDSGITDADSFESNAGDNKTRDKTVFVRDCLFRQNAAKRGAAIAAKRRHLVIVNTTFLRNEATKSGGAVRVFRGEFEIHGSTFRRCSVIIGDGGAVRALKVRKVSVSQSLFIGNSATSNRGGGLALNSCRRVEVANSTFLDNRAFMDGGGISDTSGNMTVVGTTFSNNSARIGGGGIYTTSWALTVIGSTFSENSVGESGGGGAVNARSAGDVTVAYSTFLDNIAEGFGGGVYTYYASHVTVAESTFSNNSAGISGGAAFIAFADDMAVVESTFSKNSAVGAGGAFVITISGETTVTNSTFQSNSARSGGALSIFSARLRIEESIVADNTAKEKGGGINVRESAELSLYKAVLRNNRAVSGGAICLRAASSMPECHHCGENLFQGNVAFRGGGLFCQACRMKWRGMSFVENIAVESGGAVYAADSISDLSLAATFVRNVAAFGGGMAWKDNIRIGIFDCSFKENVAIEGAGLHVSSEHGRVEEYSVTGSTFGRNQALSLKQLENLAQNPTVARWLTERTKALSSGEREWLRREGYLQGRGGGAFISLRNRREDSAVKLELSSVDVRKNSASTGGGLYLDNENVINRKLGNCLLRETVRQPCLKVNYEYIKYVENTASVAGGGLFVHVLDNASTYGVLTSDQSPRECERKSYDYEMCYRNNNVSSNGGDGYSSRIATRATSMEFLNVDGPLEGLQAGERLLVPNESSEGRLAAGEEIKLILRDAFGRRIGGETVDSGLMFVLRSKWISGKRRYRPVNGTVILDKTYVTGYNVSDTLVIKSDDERNLTASIKFSTLPCPDGQTPTESKTACLKGSP